MRWTKMHLAVMGLTLALAAGAACGYEAPGAAPEEDTAAVTITATPTPTPEQAEAKADAPDLEATIAALVEDEPDMESYLKSSVRL